MNASTEMLDAMRVLVRDQVDSVADLATRICEVPSPTGAEGARAAFIETLMRERGYAPEIDEVDNVYTRRGTHDGPVLLLAAHTDTVFPESVSTKVKRNGGKLLGPGVGDNSLGVAAVIALFDMLDQLKVQTEIDIVFVADVGEEGLGNLRGMRAAMDRYGSDVAAVIAVEGHNLGRVTHAGVGSIRWNIRATGKGGHSWGDFGEPSAIHVLADVISNIGKLDVPREPRTSFNVGTISGGTSVNTIAAHAEALLDMRSIDVHALNELAGDVQAIINRHKKSGIAIDVDVLGERPAGQLDSEHPLVQIAMNAVKWAGADPTLDASSTDANVPLGRNVPAVCIGITRGGRGHTEDEFVEIQPIETGMAQLARLVIDATSAIAGDWKT